METKALLLALLFTFTLAQASATGLEVSPSQYSLSLVGGEDYTRNLTVTWNGNDREEFGITTVVEGKNYPVEGGEFSIQYEPSVLAMSPHETKRIKMEVESIPAIKPDEYTIKTHFMGDEVTDVSDGDDYIINVTNKTIYNVTNDTERVHQLEQIITNKKNELDKLKQKLNKTKTEMEGSNISNTELIERVQNLTAQLNQTKQELANLSSGLETAKARASRLEGDKMTAYAFMTFILLGILAYLYYTQKYGEEENGN